MPEKSASISQQRLMGMAWAIRSGKLDPKKISDKEYRDKVNKIANSKNFSDDSLHKMAKTKHRDKDTKKLIPYKIGKGTPENPERKRKPYKKKSENLVPESFNNFLEKKILKEELEFQEFHNGFIDAISLNESYDIPPVNYLYEVYKKITENYLTNVMPNSQGGLNVSTSGTEPVKNWKNVDKTFNQSITNIDNDSEEEDDIQKILNTKLANRGNYYIRNTSESTYIKTFNEFLKEELHLNPGMNLTGMGPVNLPANPGTSSDFHNQAEGSGDTIYDKKKEDEDEEDKES